MQLPYRSAPAQGQKRRCEIRNKPYRPVPQIYRIVIVGVLRSQFLLLASLVRTPYEVNTFTSNTKNPFVRSAYNCLCAQETPIELRRSAEQMSNKLSDTNDDRYKSLGFESTFDGSAGHPRAGLD